MEEQNFISVHEVKDERAAALLLDSETVNLLSPFIGAKKSVKEVSDEMGIKLANYYFYVKQFERTGLIKVVEEVARAGRPIKRYQAVADEFFIPHTLRPLLEHYGKDELSLHKTMWQAILQAWTTSSESVDTWGLRFYKHPELGLSVMGARSSGEPWDLLTEGPVILPYWRKLKLSQEKARAMQLELHNLLERYTQEQDEGDPYLIRLAMAPLSEQKG